jgi:sRNA-binding carbon storage regulator CsrA
MGRLVLTLHHDTEVHIGDDITLHLAHGCKQAQIAFQAPRNVPIYRTVRKADHDDTTKSVR